jgi:pyruvate,water dikinase
LSIGVQGRVRSDRAGAGVMFTLGTDSGFSDIVLINASWGLARRWWPGRPIRMSSLLFKPLLGRPGLAPVLSRKLGAKRSKISTTPNSPAP